MNKCDISDKEKLPYEVFLPITQNVVQNIKDGYFISNYSRVYSNISGKILKNKINVKTGYYEFSVQTIFNKSKSVLLHRALMLTFYPDYDRNFNVINHKDGIKTNSFLPNLEFSTPKLNALHARDTGLLNPSHGESHINATITTETCIKICKMLESQKYRQKEIADICGTTISVVESIKQGKAWKEISKDYNLRERTERKSRVFSFDDLNNICKYFQDTPKQDDESLRNYCKKCLESLNISVTESKLNGIRKLYKKERWKFIWINYNY